MSDTNESPDEQTRIPGVVQVPIYRKEVGNLIPAEERLRHFRGPVVNGPYRETMEARRQFFAQAQHPATEEELAAFENPKEQSTGSQSDERKES